MPASSTDDTADEKIEPEPASCWDRFKAEQNPCNDWFLKQHPANDRPVDIAASFAPEGCKPLFFKILCGGFIIATCIWSFIDENKNDKVWWLAYATNWMELTGSIYMFMSLCHTLFGASQPYRRVSSPFVKFTWLIFSFASHFSWLVAIFWWLHVFERGVTPLDWLHMVPHTIWPFTISFDGLNVNRIPLRWQHYWGFVVPMELSYVLWTFLQNKVLEIENPNLPDEAEDDAIYEAFNWQGEGMDPLILALVGILCIGPPIWFVEWMFSQYWVICLCIGDRRVYYTDPRKNRPKRGKVEGAGLAGMSSIRRMSFDDDDEMSSSDDESVDPNNPGKHEEEKIEDEPLEVQPKKFRSKLEELAYSK